MKVAGRSNGKELKQKLILKQYINKDRIKDLSNKYENEIDKTGILVRLNQFDLLRVVINDLDELLEE